MQFLFYLFTLQIVCAYLILPSFSFFTKTKSKLHIYDYALRVSQTKKNDAPKSSNSGKKGFGGSSVSNSSVKTVDSKQTMEKLIQSTIDSFEGLREAMTLTEEIKSLEIIESSGSIIGNSYNRSEMKQNIDLKRTRLQYLIDSKGWNVDNIHNKLHEITWDTSANFRHERHEFDAIPAAMENHMLQVAQWIVNFHQLPAGTHASATSLPNPPTVDMSKLASSSLVESPSQQQQQQHRHSYRPPIVCDVGCGTGILIKYIQKQSSISSNVPGGQSAAGSSGVSAFPTENVYGVDLSQEMLKIASKVYPKAHFFQKNFLDVDLSLFRSHQPFQNPSRSSHNDCIKNSGNNSEYDGDNDANDGVDVVVFNECLHNFVNVTAALEHAYRLLNDGGIIIISHPRGYNNIFTQHLSNRWLVPSLLPLMADLQSLCRTTSAFHAAELVLAPSSKSPHYLAVLRKCR